MDAKENLPIFLVEVKNGEGQILIERGGSDFALDVNVSTVMIRESTEQAEREANEGADQDEQAAPGADDPRSLFQKVLSNPWEDLGSRLPPQH